MKKYQVALAVVTYILFLIVWSIPISDLPFGDVDASGHFALGDYQAQSNRIMKSALPLYLNYSYGFANDGAPWYPPQFHLSAAVFEKLNVHRIRPAFYFYLFCSTLILLTSFFLMYRMFGFWFGWFSMLLLGVSTRDYVTFVWGLWPEKFSFALVPLVLYCAYKAEKKYMIVLPFLLGTQFLLHPQGAVHSVVILFFYTVFVWFKERKFPYDWRYLFLAVVLFFVFVIPFSAGPMAFNKNVMQGEYGDSFRIQELSSLLHWYPESIPYAPQMGDFAYVYGPLWWLVVIFFVIGVLYCVSQVFSSKNLPARSAMLLFSYFVAIYVLMHLNVIGITGRVHRSLNAESHVVYLLVVIGIYALVYNVFDRLPKRVPFVSFFIFGLTAAGVVVVLMSSAVGMPAFFEGAKNDVGRVNQVEYDACEWIKGNTMEDAHVRNVGTLIYKKRKWIQALSMRPGLFDDQTVIGEFSEVPLNYTTHFFGDYTDKSLLPNADEFEGYVTQFLAGQNVTPLYIHEGGVVVLARN